jgi:hypothetical protein
MQLRGISNVPNYQLQYIYFEKSFIRHPLKLLPNNTKTASNTQWLKKKAKGNDQAGN